jgi:hypothetical protein
MNKINQISAPIRLYRKGRNALAILVLCLAVLVPPACSDYLDVRPENQMLLEDFWTKGSDVEAVVRACYRAMQEDGFTWRLITWGELRSENLIVTGSEADNERAVSDANILPKNNQSMWNDFYLVINYCNTLLQYAPGVLEKDPNFTISDLQAKSAEALAIRALCHFYLLRAFRDIPLALEATIDDGQSLIIPQSSPQEVLDKIVEDLLQAEKWAMSEFPTTGEDKGRITKDAVRAILADVYLWRSDYAQCIDYCDRLIQATIKVLSMSGAELEITKYQLIEESPSMYIFAMGNSTESIFELQFSVDKKNGAALSLFEDVSKGTAGKLSVPSDLAVENSLIYSKTDDRRADFINVNSSNTYSVFKYSGYQIPLFSSGGTAVSHMYNSFSTPFNWIFYRITDIMLMKAEALVQLNRSEDDLREALHIVNTTYMRANPTLLETDSLAFENYSTVTTLERLVLLERQRELMFEGKRWFDLVRHSERKQSTAELVEYVIRKYSTNQGTITSKLSVMNALYMPIYADELKMNPLLKQNPYYETSSNIE